MEASTASHSDASENETPTGDGAASSDASRQAARTIAELIPASARVYPDQVAITYKRDGAWHEVTYSQFAEIVDELGRGLIDVGVQPGDRVCILSNTRPEWSYADMAITATGAVVVPIYQTNSAEECEWVIRDSGASAIFCEDESQVTKVAAIAARVPDLKTVIVFDEVADSGGIETISAWLACPPPAHATRSPTSSPVVPVPTSITRPAEL